MRNYKSENKDILNLLAKKYSDYYGSILNKEAKIQNNLKTIPFTPRLDKIVENLIAEDKKRKNQRKTRIRNLSLIAASILIVIATPFIVNLRTNNLVDNPATGGFSENAYDTAIEEEGEKDFAPKEISPSNDIMSSYVQADFIALDFALPTNLSVANVEQDVGETIYRLKDENLDDIVMVLSEAKNNKEQQMDFEIIQVNSENVFAKSTSDYSVIFFEKDNISYKLTCRYDINTLIALSKSILI